MGKTTLAQMLPDSAYLNCDLPSVVRRLEDPELFLQSLPPDSIIVLDEVHRLADPSRMLKIASDAYPKLRILATGSSTLAATHKFRDTLTGRKLLISLLPVLWTECEEAFGITDLDRRFLRGGLPEALLAPERDEAFYAEWMDSFYARDIQELFVIRERTGFLNVLRMMLRQSGGLADYTALSRECDISRPTVKTYLEALNTACALYALPPFHGTGRREFVRRPKVYGFDTGFVAFVRGWRDVRDEDRGLLWEHLVLDVLRCAMEIGSVAKRRGRITGGAAGLLSGGQGLYYWRDKSGHEIDFVVRRGREVDALECKINPDRFEPGSLIAFRQLYPQGRNYVVCPGVKEPYDRRRAGLVLRVMGCRHLI